MISQQTIQQILSRIDIVEIVGGFVRLKKRGVNYLGLCPFHNEKTPSFTVSPTKEIYKCFGCGKSGNSISFLMEHEKYSYVEALRWLAEKYNVQIEETEVSPEVKAQQLTADSLYIINSFARKYFSERLFNSDEGRDIGLSYLKERGFREEIIEKFQLGYCLQERDAFSKEAIQSQYNLELLVKTGLTVLRDERPVDNYRGRIIFPIHNQSGKILGFGARIIGKNDKAPKYINTPENEIYVKSKILYGSYFARQAIDKNDECLLVEGYTDVISLHQAGIENVVASGGTSLTPDQLRLIKKYTNNLTILYDGDAAGVKAAMRGLDLALEESLNVQLVLFPDKEDPDSYVNKVGPTRFREFVDKHKKDFVLFQLEVLLQESGNDSAKKAAAVNTIAETIAKINKPEDFSRRQDYIRQTSEILKIDEGGFINLVNKFVREKISKQESGKGFDFTPPSPDPQLETPAADDDVLTLLKTDELHERAIVRCLIEFGLKDWNENQRVADYILEEFIDQQFIEDGTLSSLVEVYKEWYKKGFEPTEKNFLYSEHRQLSLAVVSLLDFPYELSHRWKETYEIIVPSKEDNYQKEIESTSIYLKIRKIKKMIEENQKDLNKPDSPIDYKIAIETHQALKQMEIELLRAAGTVIFK
ncbi:MAG: DNA primase [Chitinophagaceae bacterium]|nr:DNA primase [Chitinophagaceae bacterium]